jgi:hypothetical protein
MHVADHAAIFPNVERMCAIEPVVGRMRVGVSSWAMIAYRSANTALVKVRQALRKRSGKLQVPFAQ